MLEKACKGSWYNVKRSDESVINLRDATRDSLASPLPAAHPALNVPNSVSPWKN